MNTYAIDFETYYDKEVSISTLGSYHYLRHPQCSIYMVAIYSQEAGFAFVGEPKDLDWQRFDDAHFVAHNASFDKACFERLQELGIVPCSLSPTWDCTADLAAFLGSGRSLAAASDELLGIHLMKATRDKMKGKTWEQSLELGMAAELAAYCLADAKSCYELWTRFHRSWLPSEQALSRHTRQMGERGIVVLVENRNSASPTII